MAREQLERAACRPVLLDEEAEVDVVARRILDPRENPLASEPDEHVRVQLLVDAHRQVVGEQRKVDLLANGTEIGFDLVGAAERVEGGGRDDGVGPELARGAGVLDHPLRLSVDDAHEHRNPARGGLNARLDDLPAARVGAKHDLARRSEKEKAVHSAVDHSIDRPFQARAVEFAIGGERRDDGRDHSAEIGVGCHVLSSFAVLRDSSSEDARASGMLGCRSEGAALRSLRV